MTAHPVPATDRALIEQIRFPWLLIVDGVALTVRGAGPQDLPGVALMHRRCSAKSLLDRYRAGGRPPAIVELDRQVRDPLSFVVIAEDGRIVATSRVAPDPAHPAGTAEISILVEDNWQRLGVGRALLRHSAASAALAGVRQLIAYPGTTASTIQRLMSAIGTTRVMTEGQRHLRTSLTDHAKLGLGPATGTAPTWGIKALGC